MEKLLDNLQKSDRTGDLQRNNEKRTIKPKGIRGISEGESGSKSTKQLQRISFQQEVPKQNEGKLHLGKSVVHWKEVLEKDRAMQLEQQELMEYMMSEMIKDKQRDSSNQRDSQKLGQVDNEKVLISPKSSVKLVVSPQPQVKGEMSKKYGGNIEMPDQRLKYEEMQVEEKLKQLLLSKPNHHSHHNNNSHSLNHYTSEREPKVKSISSRELSPPLTNLHINKTLNTDAYKTQLSISPRLFLQESKKDILLVQLPSQDYKGLSYTSNMYDGPSTTKTQNKSEDKKDASQSTLQKSTDASSSTLYQQYMARLMHQRKIQIGEDTQTQTYTKQYENAKLRGKFNSTKYLPQIEESMAVTQQGSGSLQNIEIMKSLRYPASSKELQEFNKQQETNQLRFAKMVSSENEYGAKGSSRLKNKNALLFTSHSKSFLNASKNQIDSLRIQELVKERNGSIYQLQQETLKNNDEIGQLITLQCQELVEENLKEDQQRRSNSPRRRVTKQINNPLVVQISDPSEMPKSKMTSAYTTTNEKFVQQNQGMENGFKTQRFPPFLNNNFNNRNSKKNNNQLFFNEDFPSKSKIEREREEFDLQKDLAIETNLVDYLQQQKVQVRDQITIFLQSSTKMMRAIQKNCLMDQEQFTFFVMSFFQFCVEDTFYNFKKTSQAKIASVSTNTSYANGFNQPFISDAHLCSTFASNFSKDRNHYLQSPPQFKFSQKIPEELIMPVIEVIDDTLQGIPAKSYRDMSPRKNTRSPYRQYKRMDSPTIERETEEEEADHSKTKNAMNFRLQILQQVQDQQSQNQLSSNPPQQKGTQQEKVPMLNFSSSINRQQSNQLQPVPPHLFGGIRKFIQNLIQNTTKYILPQTVIDRIGGFARLRQLIVEGIKTFNNNITSASKMNVIDDSDDRLIDKHLLPTVCALINEDKESLLMQVSIFKSHGYALSHYDFFTIKKIIWDIMTSIKLDSNIKTHMILQIENLRFELIPHPFSDKIKEMGVTLMKQYEICNYFRQPSPQDNQFILQNLFAVMYKNQSYQQLAQQLSSKVKFSLNDKFFDNLARFLREELRETDSKSILDLQIRLIKLKLKAGVVFNIFSLFKEDNDTFFTEIQPFLKAWIQKYNLSTTLMDAKAMDFKFLEIFIKWALTKQDLYSMMDTEPALMHFSVNEFTISFWVKGIVAYFEEKQFPRSQLDHLIQFISQYLMIKKDDHLKPPNSPKKRSTNNK